jgi:hypothetical protein
MSMTNRASLVLSTVWRVVVVAMAVGWIFDHGLFVSGETCVDGTYWSSGTCALAPTGNQGCLKYHYVMCYGMLCSGDYAANNASSYSTCIYSYLTGAANCQISGKRGDDCCYKHVVICCY